MCDAHLIEKARSRLLQWRGPCSFCDGAIDGACDLVAGELDDGSPGLLIFYYHPDCLDGIEYDGVDDNDGCFTYGRPSDSSPSAAVAA